MVLLEKLKDFTRVCMSAGGGLGVEHLAVHRDVKDSFGASRERQRFNDVLVIGQ